MDFEKCRFSAAELREVMKKRYNGYRFARTAERTVYNATRCLDFISELNQDYSAIPDIKIFSSTNVDYTKLSGFLKLINERDRRDLLRDLLRDLNSHLPVKARVDIPVRLTAARDTLGYAEGVSLLFNMGFLTIMSPEELRQLPEGNHLEGTYPRIPNDYFEMLFFGIQLENSPDVLRSFEKIRNLNVMAETNDISVLAAMLNEIAGAFIQTNNSREGETQIGLAVYMALNPVTNGRFLLKREYAVMVGGRFVFEEDWMRTNTGIRPWKSWSMRTVPLRFLRRSARRPQLPECFRRCSVPGPGRRRRFWIPPGGVRIFWR